MLAADFVAFTTAALVAHRLRTFLTALGIAVGIAAVILLTSIGEGIHRYVLGEFSQFGTNVIGIAPGRVAASGGPPGLPASVRPLTFEDARALERIAGVVAVFVAVLSIAEGFRRVLIGTGSPEVAVVEARRAIALFERAGADRDAQRTGNVDHVDVARRRDGHVAVRVDVQVEIAAGRGYVPADQHSTTDYPIGVARQLLRAARVFRSWASVMSCSSTMRPPQPASRSRGVLAPP